MSRKIWQGDVFSFTVSVKGIRNKEIVELYKELNNGAIITPTRVTEMLNPSKYKERGGQRGFIGKEAAFFSSFFFGDDPHWIASEIRSFSLSNDLVFPGCDDDAVNDSSYIMLFIHYGLCNIRNPYSLKKDYPTTEFSNRLPGASPTFVKTGLSLLSEEERKNGNRQALPVYLAAIFLFLFFVKIQNKTFLILFSETVTSSFTAFICLSLFLSLMPFVSLYADIFHTLISFLKNGGALTNGNYRTVIKFGSDNLFHTENGAYDITPRHIRYSVTCNLLGALCLILENLTLRSIKDISVLLEGLQKIPFLDFLALILFILSILLFFSFNKMQQRQLFSGVDKTKTEYPGNFTLNHAHVFSNFIYLVFSYWFSFVTITVLLIISFSNRELSILSVPLVLTVIAIILYFWFSVLSPTAKESDINNSPVKQP